MDASTPADVVRALLEADAAGEDPSVHATGALHDLLRIEFEAERHTEIAARELNVRTLKTVRADSDTALVALDAEYRLAVRQRDGTWKGGGGRFRGRARVVRVDGGWKVADYTVARRSRARSLLRVDRRLRDGALELDAAASELRKQTRFPIVIRNKGDAPLTAEMLDVEIPVLPGLRMIASAPLLDRPVLEPGAAWATIVPWFGPYRPRGGSIGVRAVDPGGAVHAASAGFRPEHRRLSRLFTLPRVLEVFAVATLVLAATSRWTVFFPGAFLLFAGVIRGVYIGSYLRYGSRGRGIVVAAALVAGEIAVGTAMLFWNNLSWNTLFVWATLFAYLPLSVHRAGQSKKRE